MAENKIIYSGISFPTILFITFLVLKLCNVIAWSWWWVTAPLWMPLAFALVLLVIGLIIAVITGLLKL